MGTGETVRERKKNPYGIMGKLNNSTGGEGRTKKGHPATVTRGEQRGPTRSAEDQGGLDLLSLKNRPRWETARDENHLNE